MKYIKTYENIQIPEIEYYDNNNKMSERYFNNRSLHRENGPAIQTWHYNGQKYAEKYYIKGKCHRENGPAEQRWYENGQKSIEQYFINSKCHRENGPAFQSWYENGQKFKEGYYLNNILYSRKAWLDKLKEINSPHYEEELMKYKTELYNL